MIPCEVSRAGRGPKPTPSPSLHCTESRPRGRPWAPVGTAVHPEGRGAAETWLGLQGWPPGTPTGDLSAPHPPAVSFPTCPAEHLGSGQRWDVPQRGRPRPPHSSPLAIPGRRAGGRLSGVWPLGDTRSLPTPPPPTARRWRAWASLCVGKPTGDLRRHSRPAPAQPSSSAPVAADHRAGAGAGRGAVAGHRSLPLPGHRRGEVVGCVVSGQ